MSSIIQEWELDASLHTEEEIRLALATRITALLAREPEAFFQLMYRLDIPEQRLQQAFGEADPPAAIAQLIYHRQLEKAARRAAMPARKEDDNELRW